MGDLSAKIVMDAAMAAVQREMKLRGFAKKGRTFHRLTEHGTRILVGFQRSVESTSACIHIALNFGVFSPLLKERLGASYLKETDLESSQWNYRYYQPGNVDWWHVEATSSADDLARTWITVIDSQLPHLVACSSLEAQRDMWKSNHVNNSMMRSLLYSAVLHHEIGPQSDLPDIVARLRAKVRGSPSEPIVEGYLQRMGIRV